MPWGRIEDTAWRDEDIDIHCIPAAAIGLHYMAISYCNDRLTDGFVHKNVLAKIPGGDKKNVAKLLSAEWWTAVEDGWQIRNFLKYNQSREKVLAERQAAKDRMNKVRTDRKQKANEGEEFEGSSGEQSANVRAAFGKSSRSPVPVPKKNQKDSLDVRRSLTTAAENTPESPTSNVSSPINNISLKDIQCAAVRDVFTLTNDTKSIKSFSMLYGVCQDNNRVDLWEAAYAQTKAKLKSSTPPDKPGAYFTVVLKALMETNQIFVPTKAEKEEAGDISTLVAQSLAQATANSAQEARIV